MSKITFAMIDTIDNPIVGINHEGCKNIHNAKILSKAVSLYLNELQTLQNKVRDLYEKDLILNNRINKEEEYGNNSPIEIQSREKSKLLRTDVNEYDLYYH